MNELDEFRQMRAHLAEPQAHRIAAIRTRVTGHYEGRDEEGRDAKAAFRPARRRMVVRLSLAGALTVATAAAATIVLGAGGRHTGPLGTPDAAAAQLLNQAAVVAEAEPGIHPRPHQYVRIDTVSRQLDLPENDEGLRAPVYVPVHDQWWERADGGGYNLLRRKNGRPEPVPPATTAPPTLPDPDDGDELTPGCPKDAGPLNQSYAWVAALPTDPASLRRELFGSPREGQHVDVNAWRDVEWQEVSDAVNQAVTKPKLRAALFRLAAELPGARVIPHATNALGQSGKAVQFTNRNDAFDEPQISQLIFDARTLRYLGSNTVLGKARPGLPAGTVVDATSVVKVSVADKLPRVQRGTVRSTDC